MPTVELIYDRDCPNVEDTRVQLRQALEAAGLAPEWQEWDRADPRAPAYARRYGSPTVLVDGRDVAGTEPSDAPSCRIYASTAGRGRGVPAADMIAAALNKTGMDTAPASACDSGSSVFKMFAALPAVGTALLPNLACAACWPAYAGLLSALGIGFIDYSPYLLPLTTGFLAIALATLAWRARARRGYGPLLVGTVAAGGMLLGKFLLDSDLATYVAVLGLIGASLWNSWPQQWRETACGVCASSKST